MNKLKYFLFIFLIFFMTKFFFGQEKNYLDSVIQRINELELELKNIQSSSPNGLNNGDKYTNAIASHEQRLIQLEDDIRNLNGNLEQINYKIDMQTQHPTWHQEVVQVHTQEHKTMKIYQKLLIQQ